MPSDSIIRLPDRKDRPVRSVLHRWRTLTGGGRDRNTNRRTLIACSAGADSSALALILRSASRDLVIGHVMHDLRPRAEALADRDATRTLASRLALEFVEDEIQVAGGDATAGNAEALARHLRYEALTRLAQRHHCPFVATGHHADDQLETMLMRLLRGTGPRGLAGIAPSRALGEVTLIRPMLAIDHAQAEGICERAGWAWSEDATNRDTSLLRARLRARVMPELRAIQPRAGERAVATGELLREAGELITARAGELLPSANNGRITIERLSLVPEPDVIVGEILRLAVAHLSEGGGTDRLPKRVIARIIRSIREQPAEPKRFTLRSVEVSLDSTSVSIIRLRRDGKDEDSG